jgi:predicted PurR-regulated permease PerM
MSHVVQHVVVPTRAAEHRPRQRSAKRALRWVALLLCLGAGLALVPFWAPLILAAWVAMLARPLHKAVSKRIHRRKGGAALVTVLLVVVFLTPLVVGTLSLSGAALELGRRLLESLPRATPSRWTFASSTFNKRPTWLASMAPVRWAWPKPFLVLLPSACSGW